MAPIHVRRAKLGVASQGQSLTPEALARYRGLSVASASVTAPTKRTQGVHGRQCASVKGLSPVRRRTMGTDMLSSMAGNIKEAKGHGLCEPIGGEDRSTCTRQRRELGRSYGLLAHRRPGLRHHTTGSCSQVRSCCVPQRIPAVGVTHIGTCARFPWACAPILCPLLVSSAPWLVSSGRLWLAPVLLLARAAAIPPAFCYRQVCWFPWPGRSVARCPYRRATGSVALFPVRDVAGSCTRWLRIFV
jgi:hypothetical protein